jgi:hypothetical protein
MIVAIKSYKNDNLYRMLLVTIFLPSTAAFVIMYQLQLNADYTNFVYIVPILFMWWMGYKNDDPQARKLFKLNLIGMIGFCVTFLLLHISVGNGDYQKFLEIISSTAI